MSYEEFTKIANRYHYIPVDELIHGSCFNHRGKAPKERKNESPLFGAKTDTQKDPFVKGGEINKNTANRYPISTPKCGRHTQNE